MRSYGVPDTFCTRLNMLTSCLPTVNRPAEPPPKPVISPPNTLTLSQIITGCKVYVERTIHPERPDETEVRKAEVLSIRERKLGRAERKERKARLRAAQDDQEAAEAQRKQLEEEEEKARSGGDRLEYYCHYVEFNKVRRRSTTVSVGNETVPGWSGMTD